MDLAQCRIPGVPIHGNILSPLNLFFFFRFPHINDHFWWGEAQPRNHIRLAFTREFTYTDTRQNFATYTTKTDTHYKTHNANAGYA